MQMPEQGHAGVGGQHEELALPAGALEAATRTAAHRAMAVMAMKILPRINLPLFFASLNSIR